MKKIALAVITAMAFTAGLFAQNATVAFENTISSDLFYIQEGESEFAGITEQITAEFESEKVDAGVSLITEFGKNDNDNYGFTGYEIDTAYIEFRPVDILSLDFNRAVSTEGSYLPVADDNIGNGNLTSDFSVVLRPVENLSVAAGIRLPSVFADADDKADFDAGIDYTTDIFSLGAAIRSPVNNLAYGVFGSFKGVEGLVLNLGFAYNDDFCNVAGNLITLGAAYEVSIFSVGFDFVTNFGNEGNDLYTGLSVETGITDNLVLETQAALIMDFEDTSTKSTVIDAGAAYETGNHKFRAGISLDISDTIGIAFPVYYTYSF